jgi:hypothetical protein
MGPEIQRRILELVENYKLNHADSPTLLVIGGESWREFQDHIESLLNYTGEHMLTQYIGMRIVGVEGSADFIHVGKTATISRAKIRKVSP